MSTSVLIFVLVFGIVGSAAAQGGPKAESTNPRVAFDTSKGRIVVELNSDKAPKTVENFLQYVKSGHYNGVIFHRVIDGFMIQTGGFTSDMTQKSTKPPIANEADNGLRNDRGTLAMARTADPNSASAQFFINTVNNDSLNHRSKTPQGWGYTVFGKVVEGMDVVDQIAKVRTGNRSGHQNVPVEPVVVQKATVL